MAKYKYVNVYHKQSAVVWLNLFATVCAGTAFVLTMLVANKGQSTFIMLMCFLTMVVFNGFSFVVNFKVRRERRKQTLRDELLED